MQNVSLDMGHWYILHFYGFYIKPMRMLGSRNKNRLLIPLVGINIVYVWIKFNIIPSYRDNKIYTNTQKIITQEHTELVGKENPSAEGKIIGKYDQFTIIKLRLQYSC